MDALVELAVEVGEEVLELVIGLLFGSGAKRKERKQKKTDVSGAEPWEQGGEPPPWET